MNFTIKRIILVTTAVIINTVCKSQDNVIDKIIAVVGDNYVLKSDIENQFLQYESKENFQVADLKCMILEELLYQNLLLNQAAKDSIIISDKELDSQLERRIRYFVSQIGSEKKLEEYFNKPIYEIKAELRESLKKQMLAERMMDKLTGTVKATPSEVRQYYRNLNRDSVPVINEQVEYQQIVLYPKITESEKLAVKEKLNGFRDRILKGDKFSALAALYSEDPGSAVKGGELGFMGRTDLVPEFSAVAFKLKEGEVSKIVETEFGYHIIQLIERLGEQINVRHMLLIPKPSYQSVIECRNRLDSIAKIVKSDSLTFEKAAEKFSHDKETMFNGGLAINQYTGNSRFETEHIGTAAKNWIAKLNTGETSQPFEFTDEKSKKGYKIIKVKAKYPAHKANLADDYQVLQDYAITARKKEIIGDWIQKQQGITYIQIDNSYKNCGFNYKGWIK